jgi:hypothetical protein
LWREYKLKYDSRHHFFFNVPILKKSFFALMVLMPALVHADTDTVAVQGYGVPVKGSGNSVANVVSLIDTGFSNHLHGALLNIRSKYGQRK